jgi:cytochrome c-type biogenesis protein CcmH
MFWASVGFLSLVVVAVVLYPLLRSGMRTTDRVTDSVRVYRDQLEELNRDLDRGLLTEQQAVAATAEIERRILAVTRAAEAPASGIGAIGRGSMVAAIAVGLPASALSLYLYLGMPNQPDRPLAQRTEELKLAEYTQHLDERSKALAAHLEGRPDDAAGWATLGRLYKVLGRFSESAEAYARRHALRPEAAAAAADHGEVLVYASGGYVTGTAQGLFEETLEIDPKHVKGRFYLGSALAQRKEELPKAIEIWSSLEKDSPPDAPWLEVLRENIGVAKAELAATATAPR